MVKRVSLSGNISKSGFLHNRPLPLSLSKCLKVNKIVNIGGQVWQFKENRDGSDELQLL